MQGGLSLRAVCWLFGAVTKLSHEANATRNEWTAGRSCESGTPHSGLGQSPSTPPLRESACGQRCFGTYIVHVPGKVKSRM